MKLYELTEEMELVEQALDEYAKEHEGDITDFELNDYLDKLAEEREQKLLNIGAWIKSLLAEEKAYKDEVKHLRRRAAIVSDKAKRLRSYIMAYLEEGETLKSAKCSFSWRRSSTIVIDDPCFLPEDYYTTEIVPLKNEIRKAINEGVDVPGAHKEDKKSLQIK